MCAIMYYRMLQHSLVEMNYVHLYYQIDEFINICNIISDDDFVQFIVNAESTVIIECKNENKIILPDIMHQTCVEKEQNIDIALTIEKYLTHKYMELDIVNMD